MRRPILTGDADASQVLGDELDAATREAVQEALSQRAAKRDTKPAYVSAEDRRQENVAAMETAVAAYDHPSDAAEENRQIFGLTDERHVDADAGARYAHIRPSVAMGGSRERAPGGDPRKAAQGRPAELEASGGARDPGSLTWPTTAGHRD